MRFWDTSAIMPLISREPLSDDARKFLEEGEGIVVWWATRVECVSAISRRAREGSLDPEGEAAARDLLSDLSGSWTEIQPSSLLRAVAEQTLAAHPLRAADALQLASALIWCGSEPRGRPFVCLDERLRAAASRSGFTLLPGMLVSGPL
ncbi:MAG: type II toxin-antitoxin system VapC family toxin [Actinomycetota bacterium]|nr:type II toxin-antitoxin system VapC family toxin [Actinomycetota bacterium]